MSSRPPMKTKLPHHLLAIALLVPQVLSAEQKLDLANPGFEDGESSWSIAKNGITEITSNAAHTGKLGLRVVDKDTKDGAHATSSAIAAAPGKKYRVTFWARNIEGGTTAVYLLFLDAQQKIIQIPEHSGGIKTDVASDASAWKQYSLIATAPADTAYVKVWIHSGITSLVTTDVDDLELYDVSQ